MIASGGERDEINEIILSFQFALSFQLLVWHFGQLDY